MLLYMYILAGIMNSLLFVISSTMPAVCSLTPCVCMMALVNSAHLLSSWSQMCLYALFLDGCLCWHQTKLYPIICIY